jgi:alpha-mannosidase
MVTAFKPSDDGQGYIVRLFGVSGKMETAHLKWASPEPPSVWLSDNSERALSEAPRSIPVPAWSIVTLRAEMP